MGSTKLSGVVSDDSLFGFFMTVQRWDSMSEFVCLFVGTTHDAARMGLPRIYERNTIQFPFERGRVESTDLL